LTSWIKTGGGQLSSPLIFRNIKNANVMRKYIDHIWKWYNR